MLARRGEDVVGLLDLAEREVVRAELLGLDAAVAGELEQGRDGLPLTRPVVIVMFLIQRSSRCSVVGAPCTPMLATVPPARTIRVQRSKVAGMPTASIATSTPPPVSSRISRSASSPPTTVCVAPKFSACLRRDSARSTAMMRLAPAISAVIIAARPTGPAPTTATVSPGFTRPFWTPIS